MLSIEEFKSVLPKKMLPNISQDLVDEVNASINDPIILDAIRDNLIGYTHILNQGTFKLTDYINAVKYVSFKAMGNTNTQSYIKTFPDRYQKFKMLGTTDKTIATYVSSYNKNKLVNLVYKETLIPTHILNASVFQEAINTQRAIMTDTTVSPKVRSDAANSLMTHLKQPEVKEVELNIGLKDDSMLRELKDITYKFAKEQQEAIASGSYSAKQIADQSIIIDAEAEEVLDEE